MKKERKKQWSEGQDNTRLQVEDEYKPKVKIKKYLSFLIFIFVGVSKKTQRRHAIRYLVKYKNKPTLEDI